ncbi:MAG: hypothetical protein WKF47_05920 [Geodermatophilaceae bacterium]
MDPLLLRIRRRVAQLEVNRPSVVIDLLDQGEPQAVGIGRGVAVHR